MPRADITVLAQLRLRPDFIDEGKRDLLEFARNVRKFEPDCSSIEIAQDMDDPTRITMIEKWSSRAVYEGPHLKTPHMKAFIERSGQFFDGSASIAFCEGTQVPGPRLRSTAPYGR